MSVDYFIKTCWSTDNDRCGGWGWICWHISTTQEIPPSLRCLDDGWVSAVRRSGSATSTDDARREALIRAVESALCTSITHLDDFVRIFTDQPIEAYIDKRIRKKIGHSFTVVQPVGLPDLYNRKMDIVERFAKESCQKAVTAVVNYGIECYDNLGLDLVKIWRDVGEKCVPRKTFTSLD